MRSSSNGTWSDPQTLEQVAEQLAIPRTAARRLERGAIKKIRAAASELGIDLRTLRLP